MKFLVVLILVLLLAGCGGSSSDPAPAPTTTAVSEPVKVERMSESEEDLYVTVVMGILNESMGSTCRITVDREYQIFELTPVDHDLKMAFIFLMDGEEEIMPSYKSMLDSFKYLSETIADHLPGYSLALINPVNTENYLVVAMSGIIIYDFTDDIF